MPVTFNGSGLRPAPFVTMQKTYSRGEDGILDHVGYDITLTGTIVNVDTAEDSPGAIGPSGMIGILSEQKRIRQIFGSGIGLLEIEAPEGATNKISTYATVESITFEDGTWVNRNNYRIDLHADALIGENDPNDTLVSKSESWTVTENDDGTYTVNHQLQAQGKPTYSGSGTIVVTGGLDVAKTWVQSRASDNTTAGIFTNNSSFSPGSLIYPLASGTTYWNKAVIETVDPLTYTWGMTETYIYYPSGSAREEWSATVNIDVGTSSKATVAVQGSVFGYGDNASNFNLKYQNARNYFDTTVTSNLYTRAATYATGYTLDPNFISKQVTHEQTAGAVRYSINYLASSGTPLINGAIEENITISDTGWTDVFAQILVPGRSQGPLFQTMNTYTAPERTVSISATLAPSGTVTLASLLTQYLSKPNTDAIVNALKPSTGYYYLKSNTEEFNVIRRQYGRTVSWVINASGVNVTGMPSGIHNI